MNKNLNVSKRVVEICQDKSNPLNKLTIIAALKQASREFSKKE